MGEVPYPTIRCARRVHTEFGERGGVVTLPNLMSKRTHTNMLAGSSAATDRHVPPTATIAVVRVPEWQKLPLECVSGVCDFLGAACHVRWSQTCTTFRVLCTDGRTWRVYSGGTPAHLHGLCRSRTTHPPTWRKLDLLDAGFTPFLLSADMVVAVLPRCTQLRVFRCHARVSVRFLETLSLHTLRLQELDVVTVTEMALHASLGVDMGRRWSRLTHLSLSHHHDGSLALHNYCMHWLSGFLGGLPPLVALDLSHVCDYFMCGHLSPNENLLVPLIPKAHRLQKIRLGLPIIRNCPHWALEFFRAASSLTHLYCSSYVSMETIKVLCRRSGASVATLTTLAANACTLGTCQDTWESVLPSFRGLTSLKIHGQVSPSVAEVVARSLPALRQLELNCVPHPRLWSLLGRLTCLESLELRTHPTMVVLWFADQLVEFVTNARALRSFSLREPTILVSLRDRLVRARPDVTFMVSTKMIEASSMRTIRELAEVLGR